MTVPTPRRARPYVSLDRVTRCDADARRGTGTGACDAPLDPRTGECPAAGRHV